MTTNIEKAIEAIEDEHDPHLGPIDAPSLIYALNDAGLLMPDLPMAEEVEYRIVDPDTNGGEYELRRWSRHVTEWSTDE